MALRPVDYKDCLGELARHLKVAKDVKAKAGTDNRVDGPYKQKKVDYKKLEAFLKEVALALLKLRPKEGLPDPQVY